MNLYELWQEIELAMLKYTDCFDENGEQTQTDEYVSEKMKELEELQNKKDDIITWVLQKRANAEANKTALSNEISRLNERVTRENKTIEQMEKMIKYFLPTIDKPLTISNWQVSYRKSKKTIIDNKEIVPEEYKVTETVTTIKYPLDAIKKAIEEWKEVPGARVEENLNLSIK